MPLQVMTGSDEGLLLAVAVGEVTAEEIVSVLLETIDDPNYRPTGKALIDTRHNEFSGSGLDVRRLADCLRQNVSIRERGGAVAIVVSKVAVYGLMRMLQILVEPSPLEIAIFYDVDEAREWLGVT